MEQGLGSESIPASVSSDKSRVLNVRPLRCLVPIFPSPPGMSSVSTPQASSFVCVPPTGPFPPGVAPFYPFLIPTESQPNQAGPFSNAIPSPVPITSFRTPVSQAAGANSTQYSGAANGDTGPSRRSSRNRTTGIPTQSGGADEDGYSDQYLSGFSMHATDAEETSKRGRKKGSSQKRTKSSSPKSSKIHVGAATVELALANLLSSFDWFLPVEIKIENSDTNINPGFTMH